MTFRSRPLSSFAALCLSISAILLACESDKSDNGGSLGQAVGGTSTTVTTSTDYDSTDRGTGGQKQTSTSTGGKKGSTSAASGGQSATASSATAPAPEEGCSASREEDGYDEVPFTDPGIRYVGRVYQTTRAAQFAFPAVQIHTTFEGDAIDMRLRDHGLGQPNSTNYYWVIIDGEAKKLQVCESREVYPLARNLEQGTHSLTIVKRTESGPGGQSSAGKGEFLGFRVRPGTGLKQPAEPTRRMEFVGDSITCGYGNELSVANDDFPAGYNAWTSVRADVKEVVACRNAASDTNTYYFEFGPTSAPYGEDYHPTIATHQAMADALSAFISELLNW
ncbi:MAG: hypothetical protein ACM3ZE_02560 [Myxococcales bacterium]